MMRAATLAIAMTLAPTAGAVDLQGHRGARGLAPENTLPAFERALAIGVTTLELDVGITKDRVVVIHHDRVLNPDTTRGPDGKWLDKPGPPLRALRFAELQRYDVGRIRPGSAYEKRFPHQRPVDGARVPRLADLFGLVARSGNATVRFNIETKISPEAPAETLPYGPFARALIAEVKKAGLEARTTIQSFDFRTLAVVQREAPAIETVYLTNDKTGPGVPRAIKAAGGRIWSPNYTDLDRASLEAAHAAGLKVVVWTVNEPAEIERVLALGVDGVISDYPDLARSILEKRGLPLPPATPPGR